jgi:CubicO group peptidase (beta-lactamase class C family)
VGSVEWFRKPALTAVLLLAAGSAGAQPAATAAPRALAQLDPYVVATMRDWKVPGAAVAVVKDDAVIYLKGYGVLRSGDTARVTPETMFGIGSISKSFTAAALGLLVDEHKIGWDDLVVDRLPGFALATPAATATTTIRDLLSHRTGLPGENLVFWGSDLSRGEVVRRIRFLPLAFAPRTTFEYQNLAFVAAGEIIPAVTGTSWDDFIERRLFQPLGMTRSTTRVGNLSRFTNVATPHAPRGGTIAPISWLNLDNAGPAGSIVSSVRDMASYVRLQLGRGAIKGTRLLSDSVIGQLHAGNTIVPLQSGIGPAFPDAHFIEYGLGWFRQDYHGYLIVTHGGQTDGMHANLAVVPELRLGVVMLTNSVAFGYPLSVTLRIIDQYLGRPPRDWSTEIKSGLAVFNQLPPPAPAEVTGAPATIPPSELAGRYSHDYLGDAVVTMEGGRLRLALLGRTVPLSHWRDDRYLPGWTDELLQGVLATATFERGGNAGVERLRLGRWVFERSR